MSVTQTAKYKMQIIDELNEMKVRPNLLGYDYLAEAVLMILKNPEYKHNLIKNVYFEIAKKFNVSIFKIDRNIRTIVDEYSKKNNIGEKITNSYFICKIAKNIEYKNLAKGDCNEENNENDR